MRVVRGRAATPAADRAATDALLESVEDDRETRLRVWQPPTQLAFGRRDSAADGYERARELARERGYAPIERRVGGRAVAHTGTTVAFAYAVANDEGIQRRYQRVSGLLERALRSRGASVRRGEPDDTFCPGAHSLQHCGKIAGLAQRVRRDAAVVAGCVVVTQADEREIGRVLSPVYRTLEVPFDPAAVGSLERAGWDAGPEEVIDAIVAAFATAHNSQKTPVEKLQG